MRDACSGENRGEEEISAEDEGEKRRAAASNGRYRFIERGLLPEMLLVVFFTF
jgi:hypothetical protein